MSGAPVEEIARSMRQAELERRNARRLVLVNHADLLEEERTGDPVTVAALSAIREQQASELALAQATIMRRWTFWARLRFLFTRRIP